jgi:hypothetical protein
LYHSSSGCIIFKLSDLVLTVQTSNQYKIFTWIANQKLASLRNDNNMVFLHSTTVLASPATLSCLSNLNLNTILAFPNLGLLLAVSPTEYIWANHATDTIAFRRPVADFASGSANLAARSRLAGNKMIMYLSPKLSVYDLSLSGGQPAFEYTYFNDSATPVDQLAESPSGDYLAVSITETQIDILLKVDCHSSCTIGCYRPGYDYCHIPASCPAGHYLDHTECKACTSPCKECSGAGDDKCTGCTAEYQLSKGRCIPLTDWTFTIASVAEQRTSAKLILSYSAIMPDSNPQLPYRPDLIFKVTLIGLITDTV